MTQEKQNNRSDIRTKLLSPDSPIVGRQTEINQILTLIGASKNLLIEGPVGVGKTFLVQEICAAMDIPVFRVDGDGRYTEQKLTGWFDPPTVLKKGYSNESFISGPLYNAMEQGGILFINEMNRLPESVQNILLPALDERVLQVPHLDSIRAHKNFTVCATMNPRDFVATTHISEALLDRFELLNLDYQSEPEEISLVEKNVSPTKIANINNVVDLLRLSVQTIRSTRNNSLIKRGASVRGAISILDFIASRLEMDAANDWNFVLFEEACRIILPNRIELSDEGIDKGMQIVLDQILEDAQKKN